MQPDVEIIEVLDPDDPRLPWSTVPLRSGERRDDRDAWLDERPADDRPPQRSLPWVLLGLGLVAAVAGAVVLLDDDDDRTPPPPEPELADGRFVLADDTLRPYSADIVAGPPDRALFRMWAQDAQPGAPWVSVQLQRGDSEPFVAHNAVRRTVRGVDIVESAGPDEAIVAEREFGGGWHGVIRSAGFHAEDVVAAVQGLTFGVTPAGDSVLELSTEVLLDLDLRRVIGGTWPEELLYGDVFSELHYLDTEGNEFVLRVADGDLDESARALTFLGGRQPYLIDRRVVSTRSDTGEAVVLWRDGGHLLSLTAPIDPSLLAGYADHVEGATENQWLLLFRGLQPDYRLGEATVLAVGEGDTSYDRDGSWIAGAQRAVRAGEPQLLWWFSAPGDRANVVSRPASGRLDSGTGVDTFVVDGATYIFVRARPLTRVTQFAVHSGGEQVVIVPLQQAYLDEEVLMGAVRVTVTGDLRVELLTT